MRNTLLLLLVLTILSILAFILKWDNSENRTSGITADRGFAVKDMRKVTKIVVKHVKLQPLVFSREGVGWTINNKYDVDPAVIIHIERVLTNISLLYVPPTNSTTTILNSIKNNGIQVDVYEGNNLPSKIIHIGSDTPKNDGTFMIVGGSKQPFAMHLPGLAGGIRSRFEQPLDNYRNKFLFHYKINDIKQIVVQYPKSNKHSFRINHTTNGFKIEPLIDINYQTSFAINEKLLKSYILGFENLGAEKIMNSYPLKDSILSSIPACTVDLTDKSGKVVRHKYFGYEDTESERFTLRSPGEIRFQNRMFVQVDSLDFYVVQNRVFGNIFRGYDEFIRFSK